MSQRASLERRKTAKEKIRKIRDRATYVKNINKRENTFLFFSFLKFF